VDKVQIKGYIRKDLNDKSRAIAAQKFPKYGRSQLSRIMTYAFELYVRTQNTQQQNTRIVQSSKTKSFRIIAVWKQCKHFLIENKYVDDFDIPRGAKLPDKLLEESIAFVRGEDQRTVSTWIQKFLKHDILKRSGPHQFEVTWDEDYEFEQNIAEDKQKATLELDKIQHKEQLK
jgi:hypothetical protein